MILASRFANNSSFGGSLYMDTVRFVEGKRSTTKAAMPKGSYSSLDVLDALAQKPQDVSSIEQLFPGAGKNLSKLRSAGFISRDSQGFLKVTSAGQSYLDAERFES